MIFVTEYHDTFRLVDLGTGTVHVGPLCDLPALLTRLDLRPWLADPRPHTVPWAIRMHLPKIKDPDFLRLYRRCRRTFAEHIVARWLEDVGDTLQPHLNADGLMAAFAKTGPAVFIPRSVFQSILEGNDGSDTRQHLSGVRGPSASMLSPGSL
jgi:hypothetical protein